MNLASRIALPLLLAAAFARAAPTVSTTLTYANAYVFRALQLGDQALQPDVTLSSGAFSGGVWMNLPFAGDEDCEVDPHFAYSFERGGVSWETGLQIYTYPQASGDETRYSWEPYVTATAPLGRDSRYSGNVNVAYDVRLQTLSSAAGLSRTFAFSTGRFAVELTPAIFVGYVHGYNLTADAPPPKCQDGYRYWGIQVAAKYKLSERVSVTVGTQWDDARNVADGADLIGNWWGYLTLRGTW